MLESPVGRLVDVWPWLITISHVFFTEWQRDVDRVDRDQELLSSPDLGERLDQVWLGSDIPTELFLSSTISVEQTSPWYRQQSVSTGREMIRIGKLKQELTWQKKVDTEDAMWIDRFGRILYRKTRAIDTWYRRIVLPFPWK